MADSGSNSSVPVIQTGNLDQTFQALRNQDPQRMRDLVVPSAPGYKPIPNQNYAPTTTVHGAFGNGMTRYAGAASNAGMIYGQPQFFSPVHTPINWQIPSKRIEIYQWCLVSGTKILMSNLGSKNIEDIIPGDKVISHKGVSQTVVKTGNRSICEEIISLSIAGISYPLELTTNHKLLVLSRDKILKNSKSHNRYVYNILRDKEIDDLSSLVEWVESKDIQIGDYLITPHIKNNSEIDLKDLFGCYYGEKEKLMYLIGLYIAEGCPSYYRYKHENKYIRGIRLCISRDEKELLQKIKDYVNSITGGKVNVNVYEASDINGRKNNSYDIQIFNVELSQFITSFITGGAKEKLISEELIELPNELLLQMVAGYIDGDGHLNKNNGYIDCNTTSDQLSYQLGGIFSKLGLPFKYYKQVRPGTSFAHHVLTDSTRLSVESSIKLSRESRDNVKRSVEWKTCFSTDVGFIRRVDDVNSILYDGLVYNIEVENDHSYVANFVSVSNCRFFYQNEAKVAAAIDFYSTFCMNGFENECKDRDVKKYFDKLVKRIDLAKWTRLISHEVHLLGDCFPFLEISCEHCGGQGRTGDELCDHEGGTIRRLVILNPDYVEVFTSPINPEPVIALKPDEEMINMVQKRTPGHDRLTPEVRALFSAGRPIRLDNRNVYHLKYGEGGYDRYGTGMVRRLFPILSYKTKLMVAQWIVAERLIIPIKIVKVGSDERPAGPADIAAVQEQLAQTANDPNLTIVTHHAFDIDFMGACHDDQTEVLTKNGWKLFKDATTQDEIGTYNLTSGKLEYQSPIEKQEYDYNGKMFNFLGEQVNVCVTPNHMMLASKMKYKNEDPDGYKEWVKIRADEISHNDRFVNQISWDGEVPSELPYKNTMLGHLDLNTYLEFLGYYLSEGGIKVSDGSPDAIHLTQKVNSEYYERMKQLMVLVKDNVKISQVIGALSSDKIPIAQIIINSRKLAKEMMSIYGHKSFRKNIPKWILGLPYENLKILFETMINGDGSRRLSKNGKLRLRYNTVSKQLAEDIYEIGIKLGYSVSIKKEIRPQYKNYNTRDIYRINFSLGHEEKYRTIRKKHIKQIDYNGRVYCFTVPNGYIVTRRNGKIGIHGNSGKVLTLSNEFELINQEILDGMMINNALLNGEGPAFASASVGIEAMIERLQTFRREIANWIEEKIYLPEAKRQGFIDDNAQDDEGNGEFIYPKIKWNSMHLRDQQQFRTFVLQLYEKGLLSAQTVLEAFDFDPDQEIERKRYDAIQMAAVGGAMGGGAGGAPGMPGGDMGGGFGGGGGGGGGMPPMPGMGGDMSGAPTGGPGGEAPISAPPGGAAGSPPLASTKNSITTLSENNMANPANYGGRVLKQKTRERLDSEKQKVYKKLEHQKANQPGMTGMRDAKGRIVFTKCERQLLDQLQGYTKNGLIRYPIIPQFEVKFGSITYPIDFAFPHLKIGIEADGETFHSSPKQIIHDKERDMKLSQLGWTILRFQDAEIEDQAERVMSTIVKTIMQKEASLEKQKESLK